MNNSIKKFIGTTIVLIWILAGLAILTANPSDASVLGLLIVGGIFFLPIIIIAIILKRN